MKKLLTALFSFLSFYATCQISDAGADKKIFITQGNSVIVGGSSTGTSFLWTKISTDQTDNATITTPTSATTTITGLIQGTWYYQLAATTGGTTKKDTVVVRVNHDKPPQGSSIVRLLPMAEMAGNINLRDDTTKDWSLIDSVFPNIHTKYYFPDSSQNVIIDRARLQAMKVDSARGKFYATLNDGVEWAGTGYNRSELSYGTGFRVDTNKTYLFEWKGYFPQSVYDFIPLRNEPGPGSVTSIMQWHGYDGYAPPFFIRVRRDSITFFEQSQYGNGTDAEVMIMPTNDAYVNQTHTIRVYVREGKGYAGQPAFIKVEVDGVQKYFRNTGQVGQTLMLDYVKFAGLYDYANAVTHPDSLARGRSFSLVTEEMNIYRTDTVPTINENLILNSQDFTSQIEWPHDGTITLNDILAPDGSITGLKYTTTTLHDLIYQTVPVLPKTTYTFSYYVKKGTVTGLYLYGTDQKDSTLVSVPISNMINDSIWTRVYGSFLTGLGTTSVKLYLKPYDGDNAGTVWLWGAQLNRGNVPANYIKTPILNTRVYKTPSGKFLKTPSGKLIKVLQ